MCFAPQLRALFRLLNVKKWSEPPVFTLLASTCTSRFKSALFFDIWTSKAWSAPPVFLNFWLGNVLCARAACNFLSLIWPDGRFSEVTFRPSGAPNHWKNTLDRDFPTLSRTWIFLLLTLSLRWSSHFFSSPPWLFPPLLFHLYIYLVVPSYLCHLFNFKKLSQLMSTCVLLMYNWVSLLDIS